MARMRVGSLRIDQLWYQEWNPIELESVGLKTGDGIKFQLNPRI